MKVIAAEENIFGEISRRQVEQIQRIRILAEKSEKRMAENYAKKLLTLNTDWFSYKEYKKNRALMKKRLKRYNW